MWELRDRWWREMGGGMGELSAGVQVPLCCWGQRRGSGREGGNTARPVCVWQGLAPGLSFPPPPQTPPILNTNTYTQCAADAGLQWCGAKVHSVSVWGSDSLSEFYLPHKKEDTSEVFEPLTAASDLPLRCLVEGRPLNYGCERAVISIVEASRKCQKGAKNPPKKPLHPQTGYGIKRTHFLSFWGALR